MYARPQAAPFPFELKCQYRNTPAILLAKPLDHLVGEAGIITHGLKASGKIVDDTQLPACYASL